MGTGSVNWRKASYSTSEGGNCVEVAKTGSRRIAARDSKNPKGPHLEFTRHSFADLLAHVKADKYDL
jgi:hypothetical protein